MLRLVGGELYQWDTYRKIAIDDPENKTTEIHYARDCDNSSIVVTVKQDSDGARYAEIPNILLQSFCPIYAYAVNVTNGERKTISAMTFIVKQKAKPDDYIYEETDVLCYGELDQKIDKTKGELENKIDETKTELNAKIKDVAQKAYKTSVEAYGAKGDGVTDDTEAFKQALAKNRLVYVPEGNYVISETLTVKENCEIELAQSTVLNFKQTNENCITLLRLASLKGNHATINVPYDFSASVINASTADDIANVSDTDGDGNKKNENARAVPPFTKWSPQWKMSRYVTDINICKPNSSGFHYSNNGDTCGNAVNMVCAEDGGEDYMWGVNMSGLRIAGAFNYGIHIKNEGEAWNHDMRIEAVIDACKIGVLCDNCNNAHLNVTIQPRATEKGLVYAEHGIKLINSKNIDLSSSCVWDWDSTTTKHAHGNEYQHIALLGECRGVVLGDFLYYESSTDIRDLIYTDNASNLENLTILQEPVTRWFKPIDGVPYFFDGNSEKQLTLKEDFESCFNVDIIKNFTDLLAVAEDTDGEILDGKGYKIGARLHENGTITDSAYYGYTGFIPCKKGDVIHAKDLTFNDGENNCKVIFYDANKNFVLHINRSNIIGGSQYHASYTQNNDGFSLALTLPENNNVAYARFTFYKTAFGVNPMIAVNEEINYEPAGFLADSVKVKAENVVGLNTNNEVVWVTCNISMATLQVSNFSHTYDKLIELIALGKQIKLRMTYDMGVLFSDLSCYNTRENAVVFQVMIQANFGDGTMLYYFNLEIRTDNSITIRPYIVNTTSMGG